MCTPEPGEAVSKANTTSTLRAMFDVAKNPALTCSQKALWFLIRSYPPDDGCFAHPETLGHQLHGMSASHVSRLRCELVESGHLTRELRGPKPPVFRATVPSKRVGTDADPRVRTDADPSAKESAPEQKESAKESARESAHMQTSPTPPIEDEYGLEGGLEDYSVPSYEETGTKAPTISHSRGDEDSPIPEGEPAFDHSPSSEGEPITVREIMNGVLGPPKPARAEVS